MKPIFRGAMFGFNKEDVFHFVSKQSKQYEQKINDITAEKDRMEKDFDKEREEFSQKLAKLENDLALAGKSKDLMDEAKSLLSLVLEDAGQIQNASTSCGDNVEKMQQNISALKEQVEKSEALREKASRFDQLSSALSGIFGAEKKSSEESASLGDFSLSEYSVEGFSTLKNSVENLMNHLNQLSELYQNENE